MTFPRDTATDRYLAVGRRELAHSFDVDLGELMPGHRVVLRGIERGSVVTLENPPRTIRSVDELHYEIIPGLKSKDETPDWSISFSDDVGTKYPYEDAGAFDTRLGLEETHGMRDIGDIPSNATVLVLTVRPSYLWEPPEPWSRSHEIDLKKSTDAQGRSEK
jgi:hypothetical protein